MPSKKRMHKVNISTIANEHSHDYELKTFEKGNMSHMKRKRVLLLSINDFNQIKRSIEYVDIKDPIVYKCINRLKYILRKAEVVLPTEIPKNVITLNSRVGLQILGTDKKFEINIVLPDNSEVNEEYMSVFSQIGTAIIGNTIGDIVRCELPSGPYDIFIERIIYQPEASGNFFL